MIRSTLFAAAATLCAAIAAPAFAATTVLEMPDLVMSYVTDGNYADLVSEPGAFAAFDTLSGDYDFFMALTYSLDDAMTDITGFFSLSQGGSEMFLADLTGASYDADTDLLSFGFAPVSGDLLAMFGSAITMDMAFFDIFGANPLTAFVDGATYAGVATATSETAPAPVPLPAGVWLLGSGVLAMAAARRRRRAA